jgi:DNA end-binding protein Ku
MARSIWTGSVSFGLVNIPVRVFPAIREHDVRFHQLAPDGSRIHYKRVSEKSGREVDFDQIRKGYETSKGRYILFERDELQQLAPATTKTIEIEDFVALEDIDPIYFERTYHLAPADDAAKRSYALLAAVMDEKQRVGIGKVVMREKQYLAAIRPYGKGLALSTMLFADEVVAQSDIGDIPARKPTVDRRQKEMAGHIVDSLAREWDPKRYHDDYEERLRKVIGAKAKGKTIEIAEEQAPAEVLDLMEALRASLEGGGSRAKRGAKASGRGTTSAHRKGTRAAKATSARRGSRASATSHKPKARSHSARRRSA